MVLCQLIFLILTLSADIHTGQMCVNVHICAATQYSTNKTTRTSTVHVRVHFGVLYSFFLERILTSWKPTFLSIEACRAYIQQRFPFNSNESKIWFIVSCWSLWISTFSHHSLLVGAAQLSWFTITRGLSLLYTDAGQSQNSVPVKHASKVHIYLGTVTKICYFIHYFTLLPAS